MDHFLLCIVGPLTGDSLSIRSFVLPLRFHWMEVKDIVILGDTSIIDDDEWSKIKNIPHVFLVQVMANIRLDGLTGCTFRVIRAVRTISTRSD